MEADKQNFIKNGTSNIVSRTGVIINDGNMKGASSRPSSEVPKSSNSSGLPNTSDNYIDVTAFKH